MVQLDSKIEIKNFKGLDRLKFTYSDINIFTGRNNVGKSSVLESVSLCLKPSSIDSYKDKRYLLRNLCKKGEITVSDKKVEISKPEKFSELEEEFGKRVKKNYKISSTNSADPLKDFSAKEVGQIFSDETDIVEKVLDKSFKISTEEMEKVFLDRLDNSTWERVFEIASNNLGVEEIQRERRITLKIGRKKRPMILEDPRVSSKKLSYLDNKQPDIQEKLEQFVEERNLVKGFSGLRGGNIVFKGDKKPIPVEFMGDGFRSVLGIILKILETDDKYILLEEPEKYLHPGYISQMVSFISDIVKDNGRKFFLTTHSRDLLETFFDSDFEEELKDKVKVFRMQNLSDLEVLSYQDAYDEVNEILMDLRGV